MKNYLTDKVMPLLFGILLAAGAYTLRYDKLLALQATGSAVRGEQLRGIEKDMEDLKNNVRQLRKYHQQKL